MPDKSDVLVVEADPIRREGLVACLSREHDLYVVGAGADLPQALSAAPSSSHPDILVINVDQPETKELRFWAVLHVLLPPTIRVVALTSGTDDRVLETLLAGGVMSLCPPDADPERICRAVKNASQGVMDYQPSMAEKIRLLLMQPTREMKYRIGEITVDRRTGRLLRRSEPVGLTGRERQILPLLGMGKSNREFALELHISRHTVAFHITNIPRKLGVSSRVEAGLIAHWQENNSASNLVG